MPANLILILIIQAFGKCIFFHSLFAKSFFYNNVKNVDNNPFSFGKWIPLLNLFLTGIF